MFLVHFHSIQKPIVYKNLVKPCSVQLHITHDPQLDYRVRFYVYDEQYKVRSVTPPRLIAV